MRPAFAFALLLATPLLTGCIANMGELKEALGAVPEPPAPPVVHEPPTARATAESRDALVGEPIRFRATESLDPQGLALSYGWSFDDGARVEGPVATHAFATPGDHVVTLRVVNAAGLADEDAIRVAIRLPDRAPTAAIRILDAATLAPLGRAAAGVPVAFDATASRDPEGGALLYSWTLGDGATSIDPAPRHAYAAPGSYEVALLVQDAAGHEATARARVAVDAAWSASGAFEPGGADQRAFPFAVQRLSSLEIALAHDTEGGLAALRLLLLDGAGEEVARLEAAPDLGATGRQKVALAPETAALARAAPGEWTLRVERASGLAPAYALDVVARG